MRTVTNSKTPGSDGTAAPFARATDIVRNPAPLADIFLNDAFSTAHSAIYYMIK